MSVSRPTRRPLAATALFTMLQLPRLVGRGLIKAYRLTLSPLIGFECRHLPTCSEYGDEALARFGLWAGGWMALARLCRCHPWGTSGLDLVPQSLAQHSHWYLPWRYGYWRKTSASQPELSVNAKPKKPPKT
jgi:uncharacterized protein